MRIVLVTHFYPAHGGGIEIVALRLAERLVAQGAEIVWCASDSDEAPVLPGVHAEPMRSWNGIERACGFPYPLWSPAALARLARQVRQADAVHVHDGLYFGSLAAALLARHCRRRLVATQHVGEVPLPPLLRPLLAVAQRVAAALVLRPAVGVAFVSPRVQAYFESLGAPGSCWQHVPNGVDELVFHPAADPAAALADRQALGFEPGRPLLLFAGRFVPKKRLPLVRAMAAARPRWQWCVIGQGPERPEEWGLANVHVRPPMAQSELARHYRAADLLVLPSEGEGFPLVVQEAMACGLPACITPDVAAGAHLPAELWLSLPLEPRQFADRGVCDIEAWCARPLAERVAQREACARFAAAAWLWDASARTHRAWLSGSAA